MNKQHIATVIAFLALGFAAGPSVAKGKSENTKEAPVKEHTVNSHTNESKSVPDHYRTNRDGIKENYWSYKGNINPHTGKVGTKK